jgi:methylase of polypeptide subunit release factors
MAKSKTKAEYGDFQTPAGLAQQVCALLARRGLQPSAILEPTCGFGSLLFAALDQFAVKEAIGADINATYIKWAEAALAQRKPRGNVTLTTADFFATDWQSLIANMPEPILVLGNPPWVTNAHLASLGSQNLPVKSNFQKHAGMDAITGKANFDISEWMLLRLLEAMNGRRGTLAMLCKSSVARKSLQHAWRTGIGFNQAAIYGIDAAAHFEASVDSALLVVDFAPSAATTEAQVYPDLNAGAHHGSIGYEDNTLLADVHGYHLWKHLGGTSPLKWRSGIKHDCSKVMELRRENARYRNGFDEVTSLEELYLYPLLKSSDVANGRTENCRWLIVTQKTVGEATGDIREIAPQTWRYLTDHATILDKRGSTIYRDRPSFSIFGVGEYSFAAWKVAISGFYKRLAFSTVGPIEGKPTMLDDTSYFLPCETKEQADYLASLLNSHAAQSFYNSFVFWDAKRPITAELLCRLDLRLLATTLGSEQTFTNYFGTAPEKRVTKKPAGATRLALFPD